VSRPEDYQELIPDETMVLKLNIKTSSSNYATYKPPSDHIPQKGYWSNNKPYQSVTSNDLTFCSPSDHRNELSTPPVHKFNKKRKCKRVDHIPRRISGISMISGGASSINDSLDLTDSLEDDQSDLNESNYLFSPAELLGDLHSTKAPIKLLPKRRKGLLAK